MRIYAKIFRKLTFYFERIVIVGDHMSCNHDDNGILFMSIYDFMTKEL